MICAALVSLHSKGRFLFSFSGSSWCVFDVALCEFIFSEELHIKQDVESIFEGCLHVFAAGFGVPFELFIRPIPKEHKE